MKGAWESLAAFKIDKIVDGMNGLKIYVSGTGTNQQSGIFAFDVYYGYRNFSESDIWMYLKDIGITHSGVFVAEQSELMDWAKRQSPLGEVPPGVRHYIFASIEDILEVLAFDEPSFELLS